MNSDPIYPSAKTALLFGLPGGFLAILQFLTLHFLDRNPLVTGKIFDFVLLPLIIFIAIRFYRDYENDLRLEFLEGLKVGMLTSAILALSSAFFVFIFLSYINPEVMETYKMERIDYIYANQEKVMEEMDENVFERTIEEIKSISVKDLVLDEILRKTIIGLFLSIILSIFLRKRL